MDLTELDSLLSALPNSSKLTTELKERASLSALIPDADGRLPGTDGYEQTIDWAYAAWTLVGVVAAWPVTTQANSESTGVTVTPPDWEAIKAFYASLSPILRAQAGDHLTQVAIEMPPHYRRRHMRGDYDIDTDMG